VADAAMNAPAKALAAGLDVRSGVRVAPLDRAAPELGLRDEDGRALGAFDRVVVTAPAPQAAELLARAAPGLAAAARGVAYDPCWAAMAAWDRPIELDWDVAHNAGILRWAVAEAAKPGREPGERWVLQATGGWSAAHLEDTPGEVARALLAAFGELCGGALRPPSHLAAHRWRYAVPRTHLAGVQPPEGAIAVAGDWCLGRDAAAAVRSGRAAAELLLA
jgi:predicted NAD/FAD-dependent oxidoreductase